MKKQYLIYSLSIIFGIWISTLLHELGHAVAIWLFGGKVNYILPNLTFGVTGFTGSFSIWQETIIYAAGVIVNFIFGFIILNTGKKTNYEGFFDVIGYCSIVLGYINFMPFFGDGALLAELWGFYPIMIIALILAMIGGILVVKDAQDKKYGGR